MIDQTVYDPNDINISGNSQQSQVAALRDFYLPFNNPLNLRVFYEEPDYVPVKSRLLFTHEVEVWMNTMKMFGQAAFEFKRVVDGNRVFIEF